MKLRDLAFGKENICRGKAWNNFYFSLTPQRNPPTANLRLLLVLTTISKLGGGVKTLRPYCLLTTSCHKKGYFSAFSEAESVVFFVIGINILKKGRGKGSALPESKRVSALILQKVLMTEHFETCM